VKRIAFYGVADTLDTQVHEVLVAFQANARIAHAVLIFAFKSFLNNLHLDNFKYLIFPPGDRQQSASTC
jgi:hypothetical protein